MNLAYIQHGEWGGPYRTEMADGIAVDAYAPPNPYKSGYGPKIPTRYRILYLGHWRRVYCALYANSGSLYVIILGDATIVSIELSDCSQ